MSRVAARCARCGRPVGPGEHLCAQCREEAPVPVVGTVRAPETSDELSERRRRWPPGMARPSSVQYHATIMVTVVAVLIGLAVFAFLNHRSIGPFRTSALHTQAVRPGSLLVTFRVTNEGSREARSTCRITAKDSVGTFVDSEAALTRPIPGHGTVSVRHTLTDLPVAVGQVELDCT